jgi:cell division protein FtsL
MDRLVRSRVWIVLIAGALTGLVAMQVSLLKLNSGIGRAVETTSTLERSNATMRAEISTLSAGDRIQQLAQQAGMVMPTPADINYLRAGDANADAQRAAQQMRAPDPAVTAGLAGAATETAAPATQSAAAATAPSGTTASGTTASGTTAAATTTASGTTPTATTPPPPAATTPPATSSTTAATAGGPGQQQTAATGATATPATGSSSGGASPQASTPTP